MRELSFSERHFWCLSKAFAMDFTSLMFSMVFGTVGMGFLMYGKKMGEMIPVGVGLALMICPYFITNVAVLLVVCAALMAIPFYLRGA